MNKSNTNRIQKKRNFFDLLNDIEPLLRLIEVIAVVVVGTVFISTKANIIAEMEMNIEKKALQPEFEVLESIEDSYFGDKNANSVLTISNMGGLCNNVDVDILCILEVVYVDGVESIKQEFRLNDFYFAIGRTGKNLGIICTARNEYNWEKYCKLSKEILDCKEIISGYTELRKYVKLSYKDQLNEMHTQYYNVNGIYTELLDESVGEKQFREYSNIEQSVSLDDLSIDYLLSIL